MPPLNGILFVWASVARRERTTGRTIGPAQRLSRLQALATFTRNGAFLSIEEHTKGTLQVGKLADFAVLSADPLTVPEDELPLLHACRSFVGGHQVHVQADAPTIGSGDDWFRAWSQRFEGDDRT